ncbi:MAG: hypothetical protein FJX76_24230 [Armatimonadetes bacterium]|nr:hypothetical protein [Armatimonadota bacterium]
MSIRAAAAIYLIMAVLATWPVPLLLSTHCWGDGRAVWENLWLMGWFHDQIAQLRTDFHTPLLFFPDGFDVENYRALLPPLLGAPLLFILPVPAAHAVLVWLSLTGPALALFALADWREKSAWAALIGGALYGFHALAWSQLATGALQPIAAIGPPLVVLWVSQWRGGAGRSRLAAAGGALVLTILGSLTAEVPSAARWTGVLSEDLMEGTGPGFQMLLLSAVGIVLHGRREWGWLLTLALFVGLSTTSWSTLLPGRLADTVALMAAAVLSAAGVAALLERVRARPLVPVLAVGLLATIFLVRWVVCSPDRAAVVTDARVPAFYASLAGSTSALIELPWRAGEARRQYYQRVHGRPLLNGPLYLSGAPDVAGHVKRHPLLASILQGARARGVALEPTWRRDIDMLRGAGFATIVLPTEFPRQSRSPNEEMWSEVYLSLLESLFGIPRQAPGALLFNLSSSGRTQRQVAFSALDFPGDFARRGRPVGIPPDRPLSWTVPRFRLHRIAFWCLAEPGTRALCVTFHSSAGSVSRIVKLSSEHWTRQVISAQDLDLPPTARFNRVSFSAVGDRVAEVSLSEIQLLAQE